MQKMMLAVGVCVATTLVGPARAQEEADGEHVAETEEIATDEKDEASSQEASAVSAASDAEEEKHAEKKSGAKRSSKNGDDGLRFRFGVAGGAGPLMLSDKAGTKVTAVYGGVDTRFGVQINDLVAVYAQPQLGFYNFKQYGPLAGTGGLLGISVLGEVTLIDRIFVGAGAGYGILNSPNGPELHFRLGGYPLMGQSSKKVRRKGLMVGADFRVHFVRGGITGIAPTFNLGYEAF